MCVCVCRGGGGHEREKIDGNIEGEKKVEQWRMAQYP